MVHHLEDNNDGQLSRRVQETSHLIALLAKKTHPDASSDVMQRQDALAKEVSIPMHLCPGLCTCIDALPSPLPLIACDLLQLIQSQAAVKHLETLLQNTRAELESTLDTLRTAQKQIDRRQSDSVRKLNKNVDNQINDEKPKSLLKPASAAASAAPSPAAGSPKDSSPVKHEVKEEQEQNELRDVLEGSSGLTRSEIEALQQEAESSQKEAESLRAEKLALFHQLDNMKTRYAVVPDERIRETPLFIKVQEDLNQFKLLADTAQALQDGLKNELDGLKARETQFRHDLEQEYAKETTKLNKDLTRLQADLTRIRTERDSNAATLAEYKSRESERCKHLEEINTLASSRQTRISTLISEIYRLRMALAAEHGDTNALQAYSETWERLKTEMNDSSTPTDSASMTINDTVLPEEALVKALQSRVKELEHLTTTYRENLQVLSGGAPDEDLDMAEQLVKGEAQAKADLEEAQAKIGKLQEMLNSSGAPDVAKMTQKLGEAEKLVVTLEAKVKANDLVSRVLLILKTLSHSDCTVIPSYQSTNMLISEVGRLSETWEQLNKQNHSKILEIAQYDVRLERMATERAKANQKYFASEREKEALANQSNTYLRLSNNQKAAISLLESERRAFTSKLANAEKELVERQAAERLLKKKISDIEREQNERAAAYLALQKQFAEVSRMYDLRARCLRAPRLILFFLDTAIERVIRAHKSVPLRRRSPKEVRRPGLKTREGGREVEKQGKSSYCSCQRSGTLCGNGR